MEATKKTRLDILKASLEKKENLFSEKLTNHMDCVRSANGQPLNDKRNGYRTLNKWDRQNESLRTLDASIQKTKDAIEFEESKIRGVENANKNIPFEILELVENGTLNQWRKYPNTFFVVGVDKARIVWDVKKKQVCYKYLNSIIDAEQRKLFASVYNALNKQLNK